MIPKSKTKEMEKETEKKLESCGVVWEQVTAVATEFNLLGTLVGQRAAMLTL